MDNISRVDTVRANQNTYTAFTNPVDESKSQTFTLKDLGATANDTKVEEKKASSLEQEEKSQATAKTQEKELSKALQERNEKIAQERMNDLNRQNIGLAFSFDKETDNTIVKVTDLNTEKLVRQIPSEEFIELSKRLSEFKENNAASGDSKEKFAKGLFLDDLI